MPKRLIYSTAAARELAEAIHWLTQPGSGQHARHRLEAIIAVIERLPEDPELYRRDPDSPDFRLATVQGYAVRFFVGVGGTIFIERIFAPGQKR
jgi:plasmid stabilization system protein ParE